MAKSRTPWCSLKYDWLTALYDPVLRFTMAEQKFKSALITQAGIGEAHRVLDFGVGTATLSLFAKQLAPQSKIIGVDVDDKIIRIAREKIKSAGAEIDINRYDGINLPYPSDYFDRVISSLVFHHLTSRQKEHSLKEIRRVLKPGGELHIADWGKAQNTLMRLSFFLIQILDGFETTTANVKGLLPEYIRGAGFADVRETRQFSTMFGTLSLYRAMK